MMPEIQQRIEQIRRGEVPEGYQQYGPYTIPQDWRVVKLGEVSECLSRTNRDGKERPVYSISNQKGFVPQNEQFEEGSYQDLDKSAYKIVRQGEFAYNPARINVGSIGRLKDEAEAIISSLYVCVKMNESVDGAFFEKWIKTSDFYKEVIRNTEGSVRDYLFYENFSSIRMPLPFITEQQKIVQVLDACDQVIELKQKLIDELKKLKRACLAKMFPQEGETVPEIRFPGFTIPWEQRKLGDITISYSGGTPTAGNEEFYGGSIPFIRSGEISEDHTELFITEDALRNTSAAMVNIGDILYALYGANSGEVSRSKIKGAINQAILAIIPNQGYDTEYLQQWLRMKKKHITDTYLQGGQGNLSGTIVKDLLIDLPSYDEQVEIAKTLESIDNCITLHQCELEEKQRKKKALMQLLLTGIVRVK